jgi:hypothetical protein
VLLGKYLDCQIQYTIDRARRIVFTAIGGEVTLDQSLAYCNQLGSDPEFDSSFDQLVSFPESARPGSQFSSPFLHPTVDPFSPESKRAVVAPADVVYGVSRMYESILDREDFQVFRTLAEAKAFLRNGREDS